MVGKLTRFGTKLDAEFKTGRELVYDRGARAGCPMMSTWATGRAELIDAHRVMHRIVNPRLV